MRYRKMVTRRSAETVRTTCDICGGPVVERCNEAVDQVEISHRHGDCWGDDDVTEITELDCCGKCFVEKVKPAIEAVGGKFRTRGFTDFYNAEGSVMLPDDEGKP